MREDMKELITLARQGDRNSMEKIVTENRGLIYSAVGRFSGRAEPEDLFQIGAMGLMKAVKRFDMSYGVEFSTYAVPMIIGEIKRFLRDDGIIKVSRSYKELARKAYALMDKKGEMSLRELAEGLGTGVEELTQALEAVRRPDSIDRSVAGADGKPMLLMDTIPSDDAEDDILTKICLKQAIMELPPRERQIIVLRYFQNKTQSEVAGVLGLSQVQISRLEKKILAAMREKIS